VKFKPVVKFPYDCATLSDVNNKWWFILFRFARVFGPDSSQAEVYRYCVQPLLSRVLNGQNASVFAYGPTGSGMKFTQICISLWQFGVYRCYC